MYNLITFAKLLLVIGGIVWGIYGTMGINVVKRILPNKTAQKVLYIAVGLSALLLMFNRNFYLPFLGKSVVPKTFLEKDRVPVNSTVSIEVKVEPNARVIYWASGKKGEVKDAYGQFENSGITTADSNGKAHLVLKRPKCYYVKKGPFKKRLRPHIHYRYTLANGMMSQVFTRRLSKDEIARSKTAERSKSSKRSTSSDKSKSSTSSDKSKSSSSSKRSRSPSSPRSDLTKLKSCKCALRHLNMHDAGCKISFSLENVKTLPNPNISMAAVVAAPKPVERYDEDRTLEHVLGDRDISSKNSINLYDFGGLENDKYSSI